MNQPWIYMCSPSRRLAFHFKITDTVILQKNVSDIPGGWGRIWSLVHKHGDPLPLKTKTWSWGLLAWDWQSQDHVQWVREPVWCGASCQGFQSDSIYNRSELDSGPGPGAKCPIPLPGRRPTPRLLILWELSWGFVSYPLHKLFSPAIMHQVPFAYKT